MNHDSPKAPRPASDLVRTGISGLDEVTCGGLPRARPTLICGGPGCGKTMLAMEFLVRGATEFSEPGVFMSFEETADDLVQNDEVGPHIFAVTQRVEKLVPIDLGRSDDQRCFGIFLAITCQDPDILCTKFLRKLDVL